MDMFWDYIESEIRYMNVKNLASKAKGTDLIERLSLAMDNVYFSGTSLRPKDSGRLLGRESLQ